jgi:hypothetical protein
LNITEDPEGDDSDADSIFSGDEEDDEQSGSDYNSDDDASSLSNDPDALKRREEDEQKSWISSIRALLGLGRGESDRKGKGRASYQPVDGATRG